MELLTNLVRRVGTGLTELLANRFAMQCNKEFNEMRSPDADEDLETFMKRTETAITSAMIRHHIVSWDVYARRLVFKWAGWVARLRTFGPRRLTLSVLRHKNYKWLRDIQDSNNGRQLHGRILKV